MHAHPLALHVGTDEREFRHQRDVVPAVGQQERHGRRAQVPIAVEDHHVGTHFYPVMQHILGAGQRLVWNAGRVRVIRCDAGRDDHHIRSVCQYK